MGQVPAFPGAAQILPKGRVTVSAGERVNIRAQTQGMGDLHSHLPDAFRESGIFFKASL